jgi:hypothetical protein
MDLSAQALNGTEGAKTIRLRDHLASKEVFMLVNSGSSNGFINKQLAENFPKWQKLQSAAQVQVVRNV